MMRYLPRRRKSIRFEACSKRCGCLLLAVMLLLSVLLPGESVREVQKNQPQGTVWEKYPVQFEAENTSVIAAPMYRRADVQVTGREISGVRSAESIESRTNYKYRNLQQFRLLMWCLAAACIAAVRLYSFGTARRRRQWELIPRSRMIVAYICRADGKKNGLVSSIK